MFLVTYPCRRCGGTGEVALPTSDACPLDCDICHPGYHQGATYLDYCPTCDGVGELTYDEGDRVAALVAESPRWSLRTWEREGDAAEVADWGWFVTLSIPRPRPRTHRSADGSEVYYLGGPLGRPAPLGEWPACDGWSPDYLAVTADSDYAGTFAASWIGGQW